MGSSLPVGATDPAGLALGNSQANMKRAFGIGRNAGEAYVDSGTNPWAGIDDPSEVQDIWNNESQVPEATRGYKKTGKFAQDYDYWEDLEQNRPRVEEPDAPSLLTDIPTSSTNYRRPRTVAAGWVEDPTYPEHGTLTVVFRDGTVYNFYDVERSVWLKFHSALSKGKSFLNKNGTLLAYPHGPADVSNIDPRVREMVYRAARTQQIYWGRKLEAAGRYRFVGQTNPITGKVTNRKKVVGYTVPAAAAKKALAPRKPRAAQAPKRNTSASRKP